MRFSVEDLILIQQRRADVIAVFASNFEQAHIDRLEKELFTIIEQRFRGEKMGAITLLFSQFLDRLVFETIKKAQSANTLIDPTKKWIVRPS